jgi:proteasome accessory factor C
VTRTSANSRLRRLLAVLPWIISQGPEGASIGEACRRFGLTRAQLTADLDTVWMVGLYPYTPDRMIDVLIDGDRVSIRLAEYFSRPLRLTPDEALGLVVTGRSLSSVPGAEADGPLARGVAKLAAALGVEADQLHVELGEAEAEVLALLRRAVDERRQVELDYYAYGRDAHGTRTVDPLRVFADQGRWYLLAHDPDRGAERVFRLDRVEAARLGSATFEPPPEAKAGSGSSVGTRVFSPSPDTPRVVLDLEPDARWVVDHHPVEAVEELGDGRLRATLAVTAQPWLERLLLGLGPEARVVAGPDDLVGAGAGAARRILARYAS